MSQSELITACIKNDKIAKKQLFDLYVGKLAFIAARYSKNAGQSEEVLLNGLSHVFSKLSSYQQDTQSLEEFIKHEFIAFAVTYLKGIRNEYYVASTVKAVEYREASYDLFRDNKFVDLKNVSQEVLVKSIQSLVPSQRLVFNLHVIDNFSMAQAAELLDSSEQSIKANLEKARYNLQKAVERNLKLTNDEQPV